MAELITLTFFGTVWAASAGFGALLHVRAPAAKQQAKDIQVAGLATATAGALTLWLFFTLNGVT